MEIAARPAGAQEIGDRTFGWQEGYGAFTVSGSQRETVHEYIVRQEEHHRNITGTAPSRRSMSNS